MKGRVVQHQDLILILVHAVVGETQIAVLCDQDKRTGMDPIADGIAPAQFVPIRGILTQPDIAECAVGASIVLQVLQSLFCRQQRIRIEIP